jgi:hypothetical protein
MKQLLTSLIIISYIMVVSPYEAQGGSFKEKIGVFCKKMSDDAYGEYRLYVDVDSRSDNKWHKDPWKSALKGIYVGTFKSLNAAKAEGDDVETTRKIVPTDMELLSIDLFKEALSSVRKKKDTPLFKLNPEIRTGLAAKAINGLRKRLGQGGVSLRGKVEDLLQSFVDSIQPNQTIKPMITTSYVCQE